MQPAPRIAELVTDITDRCVTDIQLSAPNLTFYRKFSSTYFTLANFVAQDSQLCSNISPCGSTNLTPLSRSGLCEAVIITPITPVIKESNCCKWLYHIIETTVPCLYLALNTANNPIRYITYPKSDPLKRNHPDSSRPNLKCRQILPGSKASRTVLYVRFYRFWMHFPSESVHCPVACGSHCSFQMNWKEF